MKPIKRRIAPDGRSKTRVAFSCGIYEIVHRPTRRRYVGSSEEVEKRLYFHLVMLRVNKHHCTYLQRVFNKYGESELEWFLLETCSKDELNEREQYHFDKTPGDWELVNSATQAGTTRGWKHSESTRSKMSQSAKRVAADPEERRRRSERAKRQHAEGRFKYERALGGEGQPKQKYQGAN